MYLASFVFVGGGIGSVIRYALSVGVLRLGWTGFPVATLAVNVIGGLAMGMLAGWFAFRGGGLQGRRPSGVAAFPHHRPDGWLHDFLDLLAGDCPAL